MVFNHSGQSCLPLLQINYDLISLRFQLIIKHQSFTDCCLLLKLYLSFFNIRYTTNNYSLRDSIFFSKYLLQTKFLTPLLKNNESVKSQNSPAWLSSAKHVLYLEGCMVPLSPTFTNSCIPARAEITIFLESIKFSLYLSALTQISTAQCLSFTTSAINVEKH